MKLTELKIRNFTVFEEADFSFSPGINVFIGENSTGKSHVLKALYAILKGVRVPPADTREEARWQRVRFAEIFKVDGGTPSAVGNLVRRGRDEKGATLSAVAEQPGGTRINIALDGELTIMDQRWPEQPGAIFLPARDVLAMSEGFVALYDSYRISFDETYRDICQALALPELRSLDQQAEDLLSRLLQPMLRGSLTLKEGRFYVDFGEGEHEAHLVAEGLRKVATLIQLIRNGSIRPGRVLLWDEPEANMNPRLITKLVEVLQQLAASGVQIFIATHDYLLSHKLSLIAEYGLKPAVEMRFFALHREDAIGPVQVQSAPTLVEIRNENNSILDEYVQHHDRERELEDEELEADLRGGVP